MFFFLKFWGWQAGNAGNEWSFLNGSFGYLVDWCQAANLAFSEPVESHPSELTVVNTNFKEG